MKTKLYIPTDEEISLLELMGIANDCTNCYYFQKTRYHLKHCTRGPGNLPGDDDPCMQGKRSWYIEDDSN